MKKRILSILLTVCLLMALLPTVAFAEGSVTYLDADGTLKTSPSATEVTSSDTEWTGTTTNPGWYVVNTNVTIGTEETPQRVTVSGDVRLILTDGCTLTVNGGIQVQDNSTESTPNTNALTIYGQSDPLLNEDGTLAENNRTGVLIANAVTRYNAAIGGNEGNEGTGYIDGAGGKITINSGVVKATGGVNGAAIGGGGGHRDGDGGTITINGGSVIATGRNGAAIGGGYGGTCGGSGGKITITGGTVKADGYPGAGIGGGSSTAVGGSGGEITITGGSVIATGFNGAAIGGGYGGPPGGGDGGTITITGGTVKAISSSGAGIGGGGNGDFGIGGSGTFETTGNGNAVIFASSIGDQSHKDGWSGIVVVGNEGEVYGSSVTPIEDFTIENGKTVTIHSGKTLIIPKGVTMTIADGGALNNNGTLYVDGTMNGTADGNEYYRLTVNGGTATGSAGMETHNGKTYVKAGGKITLTPDTPPTGYSFDKWVVLPSSVTVNANNSFTMPSTPLELTAQWKDIENPVITGIENDKTYCAEVGFEASDNDGRPAENNPNTGATVPQTGDNSHMALWMAVLLVSGGLLTVTVIKGVETEQKRRK